MTYQVKKDWFVYPLLPASFILMGGGYLILTAAVLGAPAPLVVLSIVLIVLGTMLFWLFFSASCEITDTHVVARLGPFRCRIPLDAVTRVMPTQKVFGHGPAWGFALSQDCIYIKYRRQSGKTALFGLAISPEDKAGFLHDLLEAVPQLKLSKDGTLRRSNT